MHSEPLNTRWEDKHLLVTRGDAEVDRIDAREIERVIVVSRHGHDTPGDLRYAVIETSNDHVLLPASSGIAGRIHFERQAFWERRPCIYWADEAQAALPRRLLPGVWLLRRHQPGFMRLPHSELAGVIEQWALEGPHSWEQRKWARIVRGHMLPTAAGGPRARPQR